MKNGFTRKKSKRKAKLKLGEEGGRCRKIRRVNRTNSIAEKENTNSTHNQIPSHTASKAPLPPKKKRDKGERGL